MPDIPESTEVNTLAGHMDHFSYRSLYEYCAKQRQYAQKVARQTAGVLPGPVQTVLKGLVRDKYYRDGWQGIAVALGNGWHDYLVHRYARQENK